MNDREREALRRRIRERREQLDADRRRAASIAVAEQLKARPFLRHARHVAAYHAVGGELDPSPILEHCLSAGASVYLPVLDTKEPRTLRFRQWSPESAMVRNRLGIPEPDGTPARDARRLDVVLMPLVACDRRGNRLGMGGGFYDTTFAWHSEEQPDLPHLVGMAYDFQVVEQLTAMPWDVPLNFIATPDAVITCPNG